jgi:hypothetical protein
MGVVPDKQVERIAYFENHIAPWTSAAVAIGTSVAAVTDLDTKTTAARAKLTAAQVARDAAKNATQELKDAVAAMETAGAGIIKQVRAKAEMSGDPAVYTLAMIPPPATPTPVGAPGLPYRFGASLKPSGALELTWKCNNPAGCHNVIYQVYRKVEATGEYTYIGGSGQRKFTDATLPSGLSSVMYQIQGCRSTAVGDVAQFVVNFGTTGSGGTTVASVATAGAPAGPKPAKIAA